VKYLLIRMQVVKPVSTHLHLNFLGCPSVRFELSFRAVYFLTLMNATCSAFPILITIIIVIYDLKVTRLNYNTNS